MTGHESARQETESHGTADVSAYGVDRSQLRANLKLSPTQRVQKMVNAVNRVAALRRKLLGDRGDGLRS